MFYRPYDTPHRARKSGLRRLQVLTETNVGLIAGHIELDYRKRPHVDKVVMLPVRFQVGTWLCRKGFFLIFMALTRLFQNPPMLPDDLDVGTDANIYIKIWQEFLSKS